MPEIASSLYKKRESHAFLHGREYKAFMDENQNIFATQMDTVYNNVTSGPFLQTFKFVKAGFLFAIDSDFRAAQDMTQGVNLLYQILGTEVFQKYCSVMLTDRGSEFSDDIPGGRQRCSQLSQYTSSSTHLPKERRSYLMCIRKYSMKRKQESMSSIIQSTHWG